jgi:hypothetical protein
MNRQLWWASSLTLLAACIPAVTGAPCETDANCPGGQVCVAGKCAEGTGMGGGEGGGTATGGGTGGGTTGGGGGTTGGGGGTTGGGGGTTGGGGGTTGGGGGSALPQTYELTSAGGRAQGGTLTLDLQVGHITPRTQMTGGTLELTGAAAVQR